GVPCGSSRRRDPPENHSVGNTEGGGPRAPPHGGGLRPPARVPPHRSPALPGDGLRHGVAGHRAVRRDRHPRPQGQLRESQAVARALRVGRPKTAPSTMSPSIAPAVAIHVHRWPTPEGAVTEVPASAFPEAPGGEAGSP